MADGLKVGFTGTMLRPPRAPRVQFALGATAPRPRQNVLKIESKQTGRGSRGIAGPGSTMPDGVKSGEPSPTASNPAAAASTPALPDSLPNS